MQGVINPAAMEGVLSVFAKIWDWIVISSAIFSIIRFETLKILTSISVVNSALLLRLIMVNAILHHKS